MDTITTTHTRRRKYRFADRAEAEAAYVAQRDECALQHIAVNALVNGEIAWQGDCADYRCQVLRPDRADGGCVLITFCPTYQPAYTTCHSPDVIRTWLLQLETNATSDEDRGLREMLRQAVTVLRDARLAECKPCPRRTAESEVA